jgi:hypothetical protein
LVKRKEMKRGTIIMIAIAISILLYAAGLLSGLSYSKFVEQRIESKAERDTAFLVNYIKDLDSNLQSLQIQELFINSLDERDTCRFADTYFAEMSQNLNYFWSVLPSRLEAYERDNKPTQEYLDLKKSYTKLSLRAWVIAKKNYQECDTKIIPILQFYSKDCADCVSQGEVLDSLKEFLAEQDKALIVFTVDYDYNESALNLVKKYYGIRSVPALIVNDKPLQGRLFSGNEILLGLKGSTLIESTSSSVG